jgi:AraC-like DNA-binding protein
MRDAAFGSRLGERFGVRDVPTVVSSTLNKTQVAVTLIQSDIAADVMSEPVPVEDAFLVHLNLKPCPDHELWIDGKSLGKRTFGSGETTIHDLRRSPRALLHTPMGSMMFYLSRRLLNEICDDADAPRIGDLHLTPGVATNDPVVRNLGQTLAFAMSQPEQASLLFIDHLTMALAVHVASTYGGMRQVRKAVSGGLASWREQRAKAILATCLDGSVSLSRLAEECGLSASHFSKQFRRSVGEPPHRWLMRQRLERAKSLLRDTPLSIAEIAVACGFCDQSHLTRCFKSAVGVGPGNWRRDIIG